MGVAQRAPAVVSRGGGARSTPALADAAVAGRMDGASQAIAAGRARLARGDAAGRAALAPLLALALLLSPSMFRRCRGRCRYTALEAAGSSGCHWSGFASARRAAFPRWELTPELHAFRQRMNGTVTETRVLLLTDVVDSTLLSERLGDEVMAGVWAAHDRVARDLLRQWRGREIDKTDGM